jgi:crotonobetainyl-CoA:carnitine CoA-transferase CaiB-like acyl-CoA transferase
VARVANRDDLHQTLSEMLRAQPAGHWVERLNEAGVPCSAVNSVADVLADPQVQARQMMLPIPHPDVPDLQVPASPLKLADSPAGVDHPPPRLGEHRDEILAELGYASEDIAALRRERVISS